MVYPSIGAQARGVFSFMLVGEDGDAFHAMNLGADGVISVAFPYHGDEMYECSKPLVNNDIKKQRLFS